MLTILTFGGAVDTVDMESTPSYYVLTGIHYLSALVYFVISHYLLEASIGKGFTLFLVGMTISVGDSIFAALEEVISELL